MNNKVTQFIIIACLMFSAFASLQSDALNSIALYVAIPVAFILCAIQEQRICPNEAAKLLLFLYLWEFTTSLWAQYTIEAKAEINRIIGCYLLCYIMACLSKNVKNLKWLLLVYAFLYIFALLYAKNNIMVDVSAMSSETERLNDKKLNANTLAYYTFFVTYAIFLLDWLVDSKLFRKLFRVLFILMLPVSFVIALLTASRQVLIIQIPVLLFLLFFRYLWIASRRTKVLSLLIVVCSIFAVLPKVESIYNNSYLAVRAHKDVKKDSRTKLLKDAIKVGNEHFPFGVGCGNYLKYSFDHKRFSHCSYTELWANTGIIGLALYISLLIRFVNVQFKRYRLTKDRLFIVILSYGIIFIFYNIFYVFYNRLWLISFFVLMWSLSDNFYAKIKEKHI